MKRISDIVIGLGCGFLIGILCFSQVEDVKSAELFGSRNIETEVKAEVARVNLILDDSEKKYITKPKPKPVNPTNECKCNGTKEIVHGDGHKTPCTCSALPEGCKCVAKQEVIQGIPQ